METLVVHLVWAPLGPEPLARFAGSYLAHAAGIEHRLLVVFNGFEQHDDLSPWRESLAEVRYEELRLASPALDIAAYKKAAELFPAERYCFVNSYSNIRADGWLALLIGIATRPGVGAVGATGSWASQASGVRYGFGNGLGGPYRRALPDREATNRIVASLDRHNTPTPRVGPWRQHLVNVYNVLTYSAAYASFPSPHLRTNSFLIDRDVWLRVCRRLPGDKHAAHRFENGRRSMTARLRATGLRVLVAGLDGRAYEPAEWATSRTFWQGNQENLLVEDNQTRDYQNGGADVRRVLSGLAWGSQADPSVDSADTALTG